VASSPTILALLPEFVNVPADGFKLNPPLLPLEPPVTVFVQYNNSLLFWQLW